MKKLLREDGPVLIISLVIMYLAFRAAVGWDWHFIAAGAFAMVVGIAAGVLTQVIMIVVASKRAVPSGGGTADAEVSGGHTPGGTDRMNNYEGAASGTGADESGPRGPVARDEEYRSSLEDPPELDEPNGPGSEGTRA